MSACREISFAEAAPATLHLLQGCKVKFDGEAPVAEYFKPEPTGTLANVTAPWT